MRTMDYPTAERLALETAEAYIRDGGETTINITDRAEMVALGSEILANSEGDEEAAALDQLGIGDRAATVNRWWHQEPTD
jgi:hypothetical protein